MAMQKTISLPTETDKLFFYGHNCFLVETENEVLVIDPWLNSTGAFFGTWHQWPPNFFQREQLIHRCQNKRLSIFITHEHQDHFDIETLQKFFEAQECNLYIPAYKDKFLVRELLKNDLEVVEIDEGDVIGDEIKFNLFIDDSGINHDSAIFVQTKNFNFLNQNDCKIFDRLSKIKQKIGVVDFYSVQFSGANWHPQCFTMTDEEKAIISKKKSVNKLKNVLGGIQIICPRYFIPAAGPAFFPFFDEALSTKDKNIFIHQSELNDYLLKNSVKNIIYPRPGDEVNEKSSSTPIPRPTSEDIEKYKTSTKNIWEELPNNFTKEKFEQVIERRLDLIWDLEFYEVPNIIFNWGNSEKIIVNLIDKKIQEQNNNSPYILIEADRKYFSLMCDGYRWQDIALSLRAKITRVPDVYNTIANIFLFADESNSRESLLQILNIPEERVVVTHKGKNFEINRFCPHQGADLSCASIDDEFNLTCPRHSWTFELNNGGFCKNSNVSINGKKIE